MGTIINFPSQEVDNEQRLRNVLDKIEFKSEELKQCVIDNVVPVIKKYNKLPEASFSIDLPVTGNQESIDNFTKTLQSEIKKYASSVQIEMLQEILQLYVHLCNCEIRNK